MSISNNRIADFFDTISDRLLTHSKQLAYTLLGMLCIGIATIGYRYYDARLQIEAHRSFIEVMKYWDAPVGDNAKGAIVFATQTDKWKKISELFGADSNKYKRTAFASLMLAWEAEAFLALGDIESAIPVLISAIAKIPSEDIRYFFALKLALVQIDSVQKNNHDDGLVSLKSMAENETVAAHEMALYQLGNYFFMRNDFVQARNYWQQLIVKYGARNEAKEVSPYVDIVKNKLKLISADW